MIYNCLLSIEIIIGTYTYLTDQHQILHKNLSYKPGKVSCTYTFLSNPSQNKNICL